MRQAISSGKSLDSCLKENNHRILVINGGSSSIKFAVFDQANDLKCILSGGIEQIGLSEPRLHAKGFDDVHNFSQVVTAPDHSSAAVVLMEWIESRHLADGLSAVGHRVVHGGPRWHSPQLLTTEVLQDLKNLSEFDPEHLPEEIALAEAFQKRFPTVPQVACFDTAFHHDLPRVAQLLPIPRHLEKQGIRKYGFHGLSYAFLMEELTRIAALESRGKIILAHLGSGASLSAVRDGKSIDTSMSFTPASGIPMSCRSGDLDPGLICYLMRVREMTVKQINTMVNSQSGLLGISETSSDMRMLLDREARDVRAAEAIAVFCYQIKKCIGSFAAALGGLDTLVFTGGIGENSPAVRDRVCAQLEFLGIQIEEKRNIANQDVISYAASKVCVRVIHTNEELMIASVVGNVLGFH